ncbi:MAG: Abi family protein [Pyrinomonadaceae bacterium]
MSWHYSSRADFKAKYSETVRPPAWMTFEICSFGLASTVFFNIKDYTIRNSVAAAFKFPGTQRHIFESWIQSCVYVRNVCAHHRPALEPKINQTSTVAKEDRFSVDQHRRNL